MNSNTNTRQNMSPETKSPHSSSLTVQDPAEGVPASKQEKEPVPAAAPVVHRALLPTVPGTWPTLPYQEQWRQTR